MRNISDWAEIGDKEIEERFPDKDLTAGEMKQFVNWFKSASDPCEALLLIISSAYSMGFATAKNVYLQEPEEQRSKTEKFIFGWIASQCRLDCASCVAAEYIDEDEETCPVYRNM